MHLDELCYFCKKPFSIAHMIDGKGWACEECRMHMKPPEAIIRVKQRSLLDGIYSITTKTYDHIITIKDLAKCGWFFRSAHADKDGIVLLKAEFHGKMRCPRIRSYFDYPSDFRVCSNYTCIQGGAIA